MTFEEQTDAVVEEMMISYPATELDFTFERIGTLKDGRVQLKITCHNDLLDKSVSVVSNDERIGIAPFNTGHISKLVAEYESGETVVLYGYFSEDNLLEIDENLYIDGICKTLSSGSTNELFGSYT